MRVSRPDRMLVEARRREEIREDILHAELSQAWLHFDAADVELGIHHGGILIVEVRDQALQHFFGFAAVDISQVQHDTLSGHSEDAVFHAESGLEIVDELREAQVALLRT